MAFDIEKHERDKLRFLEHLYDEAMKSGENHEVDLISFDSVELGEEIGFDRALSLRISNDLMNSKLADCPVDSDIALTLKGRDLVEKRRHDKEIPLHAKIARKAMSPAVSGAFAGAIAAILVALLTASDVPWWAKLLFPGLNQPK